MAAELAERHRTAFNLLIGNVRDTNNSQSDRASAIKVLSSIYQFDYKLFQVSRVGQFISSKSRYIRNEELEVSLGINFSIFRVH